MTNVSRKHRSDTELNVALNALQYSIRMLNNCSEALSSKRYSEQWLQSAILESFLIHARELLEFFNPSARVHRETAIASDFFQGTNNESWVAPKESAELVTDHRDLHTFLAHLSYGRSQQEKQWELRRISHELAEMMENFRHALEKKESRTRFSALEIFDNRELEAAYGTSNPQSISDIAIGKDAEGN